MITLKSIQVIFQYVTSGYFYFLKYLFIFVNHVARAYRLKVFSVLFDKLSLLHAIFFTLAKYIIFTVVKLIDYCIGPKSTFVSVNFGSFFKNVLCIHKLEMICMIDFD